ncbi:UNVERIFIED_CONTAM: hypothetical protein NCL1_35466 [Trichonephila clavipes]
MIDNVTVFESVVFNQAGAAGALRGSNRMRSVGRLFIKNEQCVLKSTFQWRNVHPRITRDET